MVKLSRYFLVAIAILAGSVAIPKLYWIAFEKAPKAPNVMYSCINNDFMILKPGDDPIRTDTKGTIYSREEYEQLLPMTYFRQLMSNGTMHDTINGVEMDPHSLFQSSFFYRYQPKSRYYPEPKLYPMFESESGRVNLEMPQDFFRIGKRVEFIDARSNKLNNEKSELFTEALAEEDFVFPGNLIAGLPTTRKARDDGYFITDSNNGLFHIKMVKGEPFVVRVETPENFRISFIECTEVRNREFYCFVYSAANQVYILTQEAYDLVELPIEGFDPKKDELRIQGDIFNRTVAVTSDNRVEVFVMDDMYEPVDKYSEEWPSLFERTEGKIFSWLFPAEFIAKDKNTGYIRFALRVSPGFIWVFLNMIWVGFAIFLIKRRKQNVKNQIPDLAIIAVTGIFGFLATLIFPNKFIS